MTTTNLEAIIETLTNLLLRNDCDIIQGYSKLDNLIIVSIFQRSKSNINELDAFWEALDNCH